MAAASKRTRVTRASDATAKRKLEVLRDKASRESKRLKLAKISLTSIEHKNARGTIRKGIARRLDTTLNMGKVSGKRIRRRRVL